jgi:formylglycine-generating enzyme required for sulfatase activity
VRDLGGNASDFVADPRPGEAPVRDGVVAVETPAPAATHRVRGGAYSTNEFFARSDLRRWHGQTGADSVGFRLVRSFSRGS